MCTHTHSLTHPWHVCGDAGGGDLGGGQSQAGGPTEPPKVQRHRHRWPRCRRRPRKCYFKWRKWKVAEVEEHLPLPPVCEHKRVEHEDWDRELSEQAGGDQEDDYSGPFSESQHEEEDDA